MGEIWTNLATLAAGLIGDWFSALVISAVFGLIRVAKLGGEIWPNLATLAAGLIGDWFSDHNKCWFFTYWGFIVTLYAEESQHNAGKTAGKIVF